MLIPKKNYTKENQTLIYIFIHKISAKTMQDLSFFMQLNQFTIKRITKKYARENFASNLGNSNFILENKAKLHGPELKKIIFFLSQHSSIHGVFFKNQFLHVERIAHFEEKDKAVFWEQIHNYHF